VRGTRRWLSDTLFKVDRALGVHYFDGATGSVAGRNSDQRAPAAHCIPVAPGMFRRHTPSFRMSVSGDRLASKSDRLISFTSSREKPEANKSATTASAVAELLKRPTAVFVIFPRLYECG